MRNIEINVNKQMQTIISEKEVLIENSANLIQLHFNFDEEWDDFNTKYVIFKNKSNKIKSLIDEDNNCVVPTSVLRVPNFSFSILSENDTQRITTNILYIELEKTISLDNIEEEQELELLYKQLETLITVENSEIKELKDISKEILNLLTIDYSIQLTNDTSFLFSGINNENMYKLIINNLKDIVKVCYNNIYRSFYYKYDNWFSYCELPISNFKVKKSYHYTKQTSDRFAYSLLFSNFEENGYIYTGEFGYLLYSTFSNFNTTLEDKILNIEIDEDLPFYIYDGFYESNYEAININKDSWHILSAMYAFANSNIKNVPIINVEGGFNYSNMFKNSKLENIEFIGRMGIPTTKNGDKTKINTTCCFMDETSSHDIECMFYNCTNLQSIKNMDITNLPEGLSTYRVFYYCKNLKELTFTGTENVNINLDLSTTGLDANGLMNMLNTLPTIEIPRTITIGSIKMALLTDEQIAEFTLKGYTLA